MMPKLTPIDYDPFEKKSAINLTPVDYDPFGQGSNVIPIRRPGEGTEAMRIFAPAKVRGLRLYEIGQEFSGVTSLSEDKGYSAPEWLRSVFDALSLTDEYQGERARAANITSLAEELNIRPSQAERDFDVLTGNIFSRNRLPDMGVKGAGEIAMLGGVARLAMTHPIATLASIPAFAGLNALYTAILERQHGIPGVGLTGFLPENTIQPAKDMVWLAETIAQAYAVSPVFRLGKNLDTRYTEPLKRAVTEKWFKDVTETFKSPESFYISAGKIRRFFGGGKVGEEISPEEFDILQTYGIPREYYRAAVKQGLDIEIPAERIVTSADKPWWNNIKNAFRVSPQWEPPIEIIKTGDARAAIVRPHVSGLLEGGTGTRRSFTDIYKDLNNFLGESGQIGPKEKTPEQKQAADRLKNDLAIIKKEAEQAGKDFTEYLREVGFDEPAIAAAIKILSLSEEPETNILPEATPKAIELWEMTKEEVKSGLSKDLIYKPESMSNETLAMRGFNGITVVGDKFFDLPPLERKSLLLHEIGHEISRSIIKDPFWVDLMEPLRIQDGSPRSIKSKYRNPVGGSTRPEEIIADIAADIKEHGMPDFSTGWSEESKITLAPIYERVFKELAKIEELKQSYETTSKGEGQMQQTPRINPITEKAGALLNATNTKTLTSHRDYEVAKSGGALAAVSLVRDLVKPESLDYARSLGSDVIYVPVISVEKSGMNAISQALAHYHAQAAGAKVADDIYQANKTYHTGADALSRLLSRPTFKGPVIQGGRYILVDDVVTMGDTLAELADYIKKGGGEVAGIIVLANTAKSANIVATPASVQEIKRRFGDAIETEFGIKPEALTKPAAEYLLKFKDADRLRNRIAITKNKGKLGVVQEGVQPGTITPEILSSLQKTQTIDLTDEANTLLDLAAAEETGKGMPDDPSYEQIKAEAARLARERMKKNKNLVKKRMERAATQAAMTAARETPVQAAMTAAIKAGGFRYDSIRIDYSRDTIKELNQKRPGLVANDGKARLDELAEDHGFEDGDALLEAMLSAEPIKETAGKIKRQFDDMMAEELEAIAEDTGYLVDVYEEEEKILAKLLKENKPKPAKWLKHFIREETGQIRVGDLVLSEYDALKAAMKKAETASRIAYREGNKTGALAEKTRQREIAARLKARLDAKAETKKIYDDIIKLSGNKKIPLDYQDQIAELLEGYDLLPRSSRGERQVESLQRFLDRAEAEGEDVNIPRSLLAKVERYGRVHWKDLTLAQLRDIYDQAKMIEHLGKLKGVLLARARERAYEKTIANITTTIKTNHPVSDEDIQDKIDRMVQKRLLEPSRIQEIKDFFTGYSASLIKPEMIFRFLDNFQDLGPTWTELYQPIKTASDAGIRLRQDILPKLEKLFEPFTATGGYRWKSEKYYIPEIGKTMTKERILMIALNTGNKGNLDALIEGYGWDETQINAITSHLTAEEWKFVSGTWALLEELWPHLSGIYERMSGARLRRVEGNYFPLKFDRKLSWIADKNAMEKDLRDFFQSYYAVRQPESGFTKERTGGKMPPLLDLRRNLTHIADVTHYVTHAEAIRDVQKLLRNPRVRATIESVPDIGETGYKELLPWLQDIAKPRVEPLTKVDQIIDALRRNTTVVALGLKLPVAELQLLAITQTINEIGAEATMKGIAEFYAHPVENIRKIKELSAEMSVRAMVWDRELKDAYGRLGLEYFKYSQTVKDAFFGLISMLDMAVAYPTWMGAYDIGVARFGESQKAKEFADMSVRKSQALALTKDLAGIQRGGPLTKLVTMFYTFLSGLNNLFWEMHKKWKLSDEKIASTVDLIKAYWWLLIFPAVAAYAIRERQIPSAKTTAKEILKYRLATYPFFRDLTAPWVSDYDYQLTPVGRAGEVMGKFGKEIGQGLAGDNKFDATQLFLYGLESSGYVFGLPTDQAKITVKGFLDLKAGKTNDFTRLFFRESQKQK